jgi:excisionase family DNA binding protein
MKPTLSPNELAQAIGVSESSVKRWVDDDVVHAVRTHGGHRRIALAEAVRFIRDSGTVVVRPGILGLADLDHVRLNESARRSPQGVLREALLAGRAPAARALILSMYLDGRPPAEIWDHVISKAMVDIGELWKHSASGIHLEHRATDICAQGLHILRATLPLPTAESSVAIGGAPSGDPYILPALMAATCAAAADFRDINLGPETPLEVLAKASRHYRAKLVWLAVTVARPAETLERELERLGAILAATGTRLVVGGRGVPDTLLLRRPNTRIARTMAEFEALANRLRAEERDADRLKPARRTGRTTRHALNRSRRFPGMDS